MPAYTLTDEQVRQYHEDGYIIAKGMFDAEEVELLQRAAKEDKALDDHSFGMEDGGGGTIRLSLWNHPGDGIYGMFARCDRMYQMAEKLLGEEPYHYHSKMIMKDAKIGGAWAWHQDYGYWYHDAVLSPNLLSAFIAVDKATRENGCMQVIKGSHNLGRIYHILTGDQVGADLDRVEEIKKKLDHIYVEMDPGDVLVFHGNLLHASDSNESENPRWSMICCYNAKSNSPYKEARHPAYTPIDVVPDSRIKEVGVKRFDEDTDNDSWLDPDAGGRSKSIEEQQAADAEKAKG